MTEMGLSSIPVGSKNLKVVYVDKDFFMYHEHVCRETTSYPHS